MSNNLTGNKVSSTYGKLVQVIGGQYFDGFGNPLNIGGVDVDNGLSILNGDIIIGGTLSQNTEINGLGYDFRILESDVIQLSSSVFDVEAEGLISLDAGTGSIQILADDTITISSFNSIGFVSNNLDLTILNGNINSLSSEGLVYNSDYSGTFVTNSLVSKLYVDNSLGTLVNGITVSGPTAGLGGNLYRDTTIDGSGYNFTIGGSDIIQFTSSVFDVVTNGLISLDAGTGSIQVLADNDVTISSINANVNLAVNNSLNLSFDNGNVTDTSSNGLGLVYTSDYSGTFVTNSLVSKKYVDNSISNERYHGSFYDTTTQTNLGSTFSNAMTFNVTDLSYGVYITASSNIFIENSGVYNIQFSAQLEKTDIGKDIIEIWLRKNGVNIPHSATLIEVDGNNGKSVASWNFFVDANSGDYYELMWHSNDVNMSILSRPAQTNPDRPEIPSVILTVNKVG